MFYSIFSDNLYVLSLYRDIILLCSYFTAKQPEIFLPKKE